MRSVAYAELISAVRQLDEPPLAFVLGSGLRSIVDRIEATMAVEFSAIPGMVAPSVSGQGGHLILGNWVGRPVLVFTGRLHYYEGHPRSRVVRPMEVLAELGAETVVLTNAAGGINSEFSAGSLMALTNCLPWNQPHHWRITPNSPFDAQLTDALLQAASHAQIALHRGVYCVVTGPCYETPAEIQAMALCGADAVGMSTAREAQRAAELGLRVAAISCIANLAAGLSSSPLSHAEVLEAVAASATSLGLLLEAFLAAMPPVCEKKAQSGAQTQ